MEKIKVSWTKNVFLSPKEVLKLYQLMSTEEVNYWILQLDKYLIKRPKKEYKSHYLTILKWRKREEGKLKYATEYETPEDVY